MTNVPKEIYLQVGEDCPDDVSFSELVDVTWCDDQINNNDLLFVSVDALVDWLEKSGNGKLADEFDKEFFK